MKREDFLLTVLLVLVVCYFAKKPILHGATESLPDYRPVVLNSKEDVRIPVNNPVALSYKSKEEVYLIRKNAVENSIFKNRKYKPSNVIFGQIADGKPWMSMTYCCERGKPYPVDGPSEEARFIVNPSALVMLECIFGIYCEDNEYLPKLMPVSISYSEFNNEITVVYDKLTIETLDNARYYTLNGVNARDFGYEYVYIDRSKSTYNLIFTNRDNVGNQVLSFQNYIHTGHSCRVPGGCNNGSPMQPMMSFENSHREGMPYEKDKVIYIKLWKKEPISKDDKSDINVRIVINQA